MTMAISCGQVFRVAKCFCVIDRSRSSELKSPSNHPTIQPSNHIPFHPASHASLCSDSQVANVHIPVLGVGAGVYIATNAILGAYVYMSRKVCSTEWCLVWKMVG
jgi:hypothetical protein